MDTIYTIALGWVLEAAYVLIEECIWHTRGLRAEDLNIPTSDTFHLWKCSL